MRSFLTILLLQGIVRCAFCQTPINGIINTYHKVIQVIPDRNCVRVDNVAGLRFNERVMIIQMKGATTNTSNTASFGSVTALNNAGNYEINNVCWVRLDTVFLVRTLAQSYSVADKVQLVGIPEFASAVVTDSLKAAPWDSSSGKGGVLALTVTDELLLNAPISASNAGYRGGAYATSNSTCNNLFPANNYNFNPTGLAPQDGAYKGESLTDLGITFMGGKGAMANGGGGGNNHNNGGGGGANLGAGGQGGGNSSASGCSVANPGKGGYALASNNGTKIFMGGGGGAGHANSGLPSAGGGRGGGIIFIQANSLHSNGYKIMANGQKGGSTTGDGASGGGGGGTILLSVNNYVDPVSIEATGGSGGDESDDNTSQKCYGEGGGGGGGILYLKSASVPTGTVNVHGGTKGNKMFFLNCGTLVAATAGTDGSISTNYSFRQSATISITCEDILPVHFLFFNAETNQSEVNLAWNVSDGIEVRRFILEKKEGSSEWKQLAIVLPDLNIAQYYFRVAGLPAEDCLYRVGAEQFNGKVIYSEIRKIRGSNHTGGLLVYPNPATSSVSIVHELEKDTELKIFDALGKLVCRKTIKANGMLYHQDISFLKKGVYLVVVGGSSSPLIIQ